ncbi:MAG: hypothetical protein KF745_03915 [Phycisphaeraceae bacterium]|nr:hypothetical protein [Phycisphaeraceae bacterium]
MILLAIYAVFIWFLASRWRRSWRSVAVVVAGVAAIAAPVHLLSLYDKHALFGVLRSELFSVLLWPYAGTVLAVGLFICVLPRRVPGDGYCRVCGYDLHGLDPRGLMCPECGAEQFYRCGVCDLDFGDADPLAIVCPRCHTPWSGPGCREIVLNPPPPEAPCGEATGRQSPPPAAGQSPALNPAAPATPRRRAAPTREARQSTSTGSQ